MKFDFYSPRCVDYFLCLFVIICHILIQEDMIMIVKCILLALSASIDALGLGITYGIKRLKCLV